MSHHVVFDAAAQAMRCHHCGAVKSLPMPTPILEACQRLNAFNDEHKDCKKGSFAVLAKLAKWADYADQKGYSDGGVFVACRDRAQGTAAEITFGECRAVRELLNAERDCFMPVGVDSEGGSHD